MKNAFLGTFVLFAILSVSVKAAESTTENNKLADKDVELVDQSIELEGVTVSASRQNLLGIASSASQGVAPAERIINVPLTRPQDVLEQIPGLVVTQHSGSGKAPQFFLRGFNLDHGTDFSLSIEGTPLNLRSHGHGQGYADATILIPELIESIDFRKGPYFADLGDFSLAGAARINYYQKLPTNIASTSIGEFGYRRLLLAGSTTLDSRNFLYAIEGIKDDGPFKTSEDFKKLNTVFRWGTGNTENGLDLLLSLYKSNGLATTQIPQRAERSGLIDRFQGIDTTDAVRTHRYSISADWRNGPLKANAYYVDSRLNLFSNFTYFSADPVNGDQIEQEDKRATYGANVSYEWLNQISHFDLEQKVGLDLRNDDIRAIGLYNTSARQRINTVRNDKVDEFSTGIWWQGALQVTDKLRTTLGLRGDYYMFDVDSDTDANSGRQHDKILSPKFGVAYQANKSTELYFSYGRGFHSNDARGTTTTIDPNTGDPAESIPGLVSGEGGEIGLRANWLPNWQTTLALFQLNIDSEILFIGDAGNTEAGRPSKRVGLEWTNHYRPYSWLYLDADVALSRAKFRDNSIDGNEIPGSIERTASVSVTAGHDLGWYGSARMRYFGSRPLIEDDSQRSNSTITTNARLGYRAIKNVNVALDIINLFDREDSEIDYFYASRLPNEAADVDDTHFRPINPRTLRLTLTYNY